MEAFAFNATEQGLLIAAGALFVIQAIYYFALYNRINLRNRAARKNELRFSDELPPVSILICARNETENLRRSLPAMLAQDYPQFELIVINDGEKNENEAYLSQLEDRHKNLYHSFVPNSSRYISRKKLAITLGVRAARYEWLVLTEANCLPQSNQWLRLLARNFTSRTEVVLGYSGYEKGGGWLQKQVSFDNLFASMRYLGFALAGSPYMGIGRNLAYRKSLFFAQKGFSAHLDLQRGDDDLFVNQVATSNNTRVEIDPASIVRMLPLERKRDWREEKIGYASTTPLYKGIQRWLNGWETTTRLLFHIAWIAAMVVGILHAHWLVAGIALLLFGVRFAMQVIIINRTAKTLDEKQSYGLILFVFDFLQPLQSLNWKLRYRFRDRREFLRK